MIQIILKIELIGVFILNELRILFNISFSFIDSNNSIPILVFVINSLFKSFIIKILNLIFLQQKFKYHESKNLP